MATSENSVTEETELTVASKPKTVKVDGVNEPAGM